jgi:hypothetical protein
MPPGIPSEHSGNGGYYILYSIAVVADGDFRYEMTTKSERSGEDR